MRFRLARDLGLKTKGQRRQRTKQLSFRRSKRCVWCNIVVKPDGLGPSRKTREHLVPLSLGGGNGENVAVACFRCNNTRGTDMTWIRWSHLPKWFPAKIGQAYQWVGKGEIIPIAEGPDEQGLEQ